MCKSSKGMEKDATSSQLWNFEHLLPWINLCKGGKGMEKDATSQFWNFEHLLPWKNLCKILLVMLVQSRS